MTRAEISTLAFAGRRLHTGDVGNSAGDFDMDGAGSEAQPSGIDKSTAFLSSIGGFLTALVALISFFVTFPEKFHDMLFPHHQESGFVKAAREVNAIVYSKKIRLKSELAQCNDARQTYDGIHDRALSAERIGEFAKAFDAAEGREKLETEYRKLAQVFVNLNEAVAWQQSAGDSGCLDFN